MTLHDLFVARKKTVVSRKVDRHYYRTPLQQAHSRAVFPLLYETYKGVMGTAELPVEVVENQGAEIARGHQDVMTSVQLHTQECIARQDDMLPGGVPQRLVINRQVKFGMRNNGSHGDNAARKLKSVEVGRSYLDLCDAIEALRFVDDLKARRVCEIDDLYDALNLALAAAREIYATAYRATHGRYNPRKEGAIIPGGGTVRVYAVDPGTRNYARCLLEINELCDPRATLAGDEAEGGERDDVYGGALPAFRILQWELLDFKTNKTLALFRESPGLAGPVFYRPRSRDVVAMLSRGAAEPGATTPVARKRKRSGTGAKRVRKTADAAAAVVIDITHM